MLEDLNREDDPKKITKKPLSEFCPNSKAITGYCLEFDKAANQKLTHGASEDSVPTADGAFNY